MVAGAADEGAATAEVAGATAAGVVGASEVEGALALPAVLEVDCFAMDASKMGP